VRGLYEGKLSSKSAPRTTSLLASFRAGTFPLYTMRCAVRFPIPNISAISSIV
jgi:hypothetical protein